VKNDGIARVRGLQPPAVLAPMPESGGCSPQPSWPLCPSQGAAAPSRPGSYAYVNQSINKSFDQI